MVQSPPLPRAVRVARSRDAVCDVALELFTAQGFDATTAEQISEHAGVSPSSFFRYFPTKASIVFHRDFGFMRSFAAAYVAQPLSIGDFQALRATFVALCAEVQPLRARVEAGVRVVELWADEAFGYLQAYTGDTLDPASRRRRAIAIEPMTCPPNAFATGIDVIALEPGATWSGRWGIGPRGA